MYDVALAREILQQIHSSTQTILKRFEPIETEVVYSVCANHIDNLASTIQQILDDLQ